METGPFDRPLELGDVPGPDLVGRGGQQFGFDVARVAELAPAFARAAIGGERPVHGAHRAHVAAFVEQRGVDRRRRRVAEAFAVEHLEQRLLLEGVERQRWPRPRRAARVRSVKGEAV